MICRQIGFQNLIIFVGCVNLSTLISDQFFKVTVPIQTSENEHLKIHLISVAKMAIALLPFYQ